MDGKLLQPARPITSPIGGRPPGLRVERRGEVLHLQFAWRCFEALALGVLGLFWVGGAALLATMAPTAGLAAAARLGGVPGLVLCYVALAGMLNRTRVEATRESVRVRHGPVPVGGSAVVAAGEIFQLDVEERTLVGGWGKVAFLWAVLESGERVCLSRHVVRDRGGMARAIEKELEGHLGIANRPVICPGCGYDLRRSERRCPECGHDLRRTWNKHERRAWKQGGL